MAVYAALFRGINVGGRAKVTMKDLKDLFDSLGFTGVSTYVQSGNVVFSTRKSDRTGMQRSIEKRVRESLGLEVTVIIRSASELRAVLTANPLAGRTDDDRLLHVTFLSDKPQKEKVRGLEDFDAARDELTVKGTEVYLYCPGGYGETKLNNSFLEKRLGVRATTRNWRTVGKLAEMTA